MSAARLPVETPLAWRALRAWCYRQAKTWRTLVTMSLFYPTLYLAAIGVGLGSLVDHHLAGVASRASLGGVSDLAFVAPGLLAASAMQIGTQSATWPVFGAMRWDRTYASQLATPLRVVDVLVGHVGYIVVRLLATSVVFLAVIAAFGVVASPQAVLAVPAAVLTGAACATPLFALSATVETEVAFSPLQRLVVVPLFLFSGDFFPISRLPGWLQALAEATPLYHGVALCRGATLGRLDHWSMLGHLAYLVALGSVGLAAARRRFERRLAR